MVFLPHRKHLIELFPPFLAAAVLSGHGMDHRFDPGCRGNPVDHIPQPHDPGAAVAHRRLVAERDRCSADFADVLGPLLLEVAELGHRIVISAAVAVRVHFCFMR